MKLKSVHFSTWIIFLLLNICNGQVKEENNFPDTSLYKVDTLINNVNINNKLFSVEFLRDNHRVTCPDKHERDILTLVIKSSKPGKVKYIRRFTENEYTVFKVKHDNLKLKGRLFLEIKSDGGGSGFSGKCFEVTTHNGDVEMYPVYNFDELSLIYFNSDDEIIILEGIWNFKVDESHFSNHQYTITKCNYAGTKFKHIKLGKTKLKYASFYDAAPRHILAQIKKKEPLLLKSINIE